jgi:hypothetical protein
MSINYVVVQERGVKGADAPTWLHNAFTIPANWDKTITVTNTISAEADGDKNFYIIYNGLHYGTEFFNINNNVATWTHPTLDIDQGDIITVWYVASI